MISSKHRFDQRLLGVNSERGTTQTECPSSLEMTVMPFAHRSRSQKHLEACLRTQRVAFLGPTNLQAALSLYYPRGKAYPHDGIRKPFRKRNRYIWQPYTGLATEAAEKQLDLDAGPYFLIVVDLLGVPSLYSHTRVRDCDFREDSLDPDYIFSGEQNVPPFRTASIASGLLAEGLSAFGP
jgi:hypothetical protein